jgi:hypothetical protein
MFPRLFSVRPKKRRSPSRANHRGIECLEDRILLYSTTGDVWTYGSRITYSFIPDGTSVGGIPSTLFQTMNAVAPTVQWEQAIEKAAAIWQVVAKVNLVQVPDDGTPVGAAGDQQGDPRFGDIRIGAYPQSGGTLGINILPPPANGGTDAGDIFFNSSAQWNLGSNYDLETVAIHEFGHALGLGESQIQTATMYGVYNNVRQSLTSDDTTGVQSIWGAPSDTSGITTSSTALNLNPYLNSQAQIAVGGESIASSSDYNWYKVTVPSNATGTMVVTMQSSNLSSLSPRLAIYELSSGNLQSLGQSTAANAYGATVKYTVSNVAPGEVFYFRASAANTGPGSDGAYGLEVNFGSSAQAPVAPPNTVVASQPDKGSGSAAQTTGSSSGGLGLQLGSLLGVSLSLNGGLSLSANVGPIDLGIQLQIGTLNVWADPAEAGPHVHAASHPHGPHSLIGSHRLPNLSHATNGAVLHPHGNSIDAPSFRTGRAG